MTTEKPDWADIDIDAKRAIIRPLWEEGKSATEIMAYFTGATRNMIIGQISRGKMSSGRPPRPTVRAKAPGSAKRMMNPANLDRPMKPKPVSRSTSIVSTSAFVTTPDPDPVSQSVLDMINRERPPLAGTTPIPITALPNRPGVRCRFPVDGGYCGAPSGEHVYCPTHHAIAYKPAEKFRMPKEARR